MREAAISVERLTKTYGIIEGSTDVNRITDAMLQRLRHPLRRPEKRLFSAIDDVTFEIPRGEAVGIIGRNGAGKSTLLKLLTRVTAPTSGTIVLGGRVGSLLEVGTGFHPELTGRENIFLNGSLLGMTRREIRTRFEEIVDFSGVEKFLETPVKRYSSGMYVRLAFAVAAHLETEILAIDEVLAVGDSEFRAKSIAKMRDAARSGRTVLYVSHQPETVTALCSSAMFLDRGRVAFNGDVDGAFETYRASFASFSASQREASLRPGSGELRFEWARLAERTQAPADDTIVEFQVPPSRHFAGKYFVSCHVNDADGNVVLQCDSRLLGRWFDGHLGFRGRLTIRSLWFNPGRYTVDLFLCQSGILDRWEAVDAFEVVPTSPYKEAITSDTVGQARVLSDFDYEALR